MTSQMQKGRETKKSNGLSNSACLKRDFWALSRYYPIPVGSSSDMSDLLDQLLLLCSCIHQRVLAILLSTSLPSEPTSHPSPSLVDVLL